MAITTYSELQTAVANWINRTDLTDRIPEFISLAEAVIRREVRTARQEVSVDTDTVIGQNYIDLPTDFNGGRSIYVKGSENVLLQQESLDTLRAVVGGSVTGKPVMYAISGTKAYLAPTPDSVYTTELFYYEFSPLSDTNTTNSVLTHSPDIYLFLSLSFAAQFIYDHALEQKMLVLASKAIEETNERDADYRFLTPMRARAI